MTFAFTWVRWLIFGKNLSEILHNFEKTQNQLNRFHDRTDRRMRKKQDTCNRLGAQIVTHAEDMSRAQRVNDNLSSMLNDTLATKEAA